MKRMWLNISKYGCVISVLFMLVAGCKKFVHVDEPNDSLTTGAVFSNDSLALAAVTGLYLNIMKSPRIFLNGAMSLFPALSADELARTSTMPSLEDQFANNSILSSNQLINVNLWKAAYTYIYQCNICIEGLKRSTGVSEALKNRLLGEVQFVRALCYHYLVNVYGDLPLALGTNADVNAMLPRSPVNQVYDQIEADLTAASDLLMTDKRNTIPSRYSAQALLARVYLYRENWSKAAEMATAVVNSGQYSLVGDLNKVFIDTSNEIIFQWLPVQDKMNSPEGFMFVPPGGRPAYMLTNDLLGAFEVGDLRRTKWVNSVAIGATTYNYPYKFKLFSSPAPPTEYNVVLRLAEQYLIRAEAFVKLGRIPEAVTDLNAIRKRAGLSEFSTAIGAGECLQKIAQERRIELFAEWGHRWFDLKRTNLANTVLSAKGSNWHTEDQLYPIPATELEFAPNLKQNPGYE